MEVRMEIMDVSADCQEAVEWFAEKIFERQLERFHDRFGRVPSKCDPVFFRAGTGGPEPLCALEILSSVTGEALEDECLEFDSPEGARAFGILVMMRMGLSPEAAEDAVLGRGRFALH